MLPITNLRTVILFLILGFFVYVVLIAISDFSAVYERIVNFHNEYIPYIISIVIITIILRALRYHLYLKSVDINLKFKQSLVIYVAGLSMELTPIRFGQFITSYILKEKFNQPIIKSAPIIPAERITDLIGLVAISIPAILFIGNISWVITAAIILLSFIVIITQKRNLFESLSKPFSKYKKLEKILTYGQDFTKNAYLLMKPKILGIASLISAVTWAIEGIAIYLILLALDIKIGIFDSILVYTKSAFIGGISFTPSGLGTADGSFVTFLSAYGIELSLATSAIVITRLFFMWSRIIVGFIFLKLSFSKNYLNQGS